MENLKDTHRVKYNILLTHMDPVLNQHIRGRALLGNGDGRMSFTSKFLFRIVQITQLDTGVFRCTNDDGIKWLIINVENF